MGQARDSEFAKKSGWNDMADNAIQQSKESPGSSVFFGGGSGGVAKGTGGGLPRFAGKAFGLGNAFKGMFGGGGSASFLDQSRGN